MLDHPKEDVIFYPEGYVICYRSVYESFTSF